MSVMKQVLLPMVLLCAALAVSVCGGEEWPAWRGPRGDGTSLEQDVPTRWTATENIVWKVEVPGVGHASPIVFSDYVFLATCLEAGLRSYDIAARYGGDEFLALCVGCRAGEIQIPISRMLKALMATEITLPCGDVSISASLGAAVRHDGFAESNPFDLFAEADRCLYRAKATRGTAFWVEFGSEFDGVPVKLDHLAVEDHDEIAESAELMNY